MTTPEEKLGASLMRLWKRQSEHNTKVKRIEKRSHEEWIQHYLLGTVAEVTEMLNEINWKVHQHPTVDWDSVGALLELADITKYILSIWIHLGCSPFDFLDWAHAKSDIVEHRFWNEWSPAPTGKIVLISDIDGTIGDWRSAFADWARGYSGLSPRDVSKTLSFDLDNDWAYGEYEKAKKLFEASGGYLHIPPFKDGVQFIQEAQEVGALLYVCTARPKRPGRIFYDTYTWCKEQELAPHWVHFVENQRISLALQLAKKNTVIALEDNPELAQRYARNGILTIVRESGYNSHLSQLNDPNIILTGNFVQSAMTHPELSKLKLSKRWHYVEAK